MKVKAYTVSSDTIVDVDNNIHIYIQTHVNSITKPFQGTMCIRTCIAVCMVHNMPPSDTVHAIEKENMYVGGSGVISLQLTEEPLLTVNTYTCICMLHDLPVPVYLGKQLYYITIIFLVTLIEKWLKHSYHAV